MRTAVLDAPETLRGRTHGRRLRAFLALWAVMAIVLFAASAHEAAAHTGAEAQPTDPVHIPDANLRAKVEAALNKASGATITHADMAGLRTCIYANPTGCLQLVGPFSDQFNVAGRIHDLTGLEHATGLTRVRLRYHPVSDLTPLAGLTSLTELTLIHADVQDLTPIAGLTNLQILQLPESHRISDLAPLAGLTNLRQLSLTVNRISDLTPLAGLTGLTQLYLSDNRISDLTPLAGLTSLDRLTLAGNRITNIEPLRGMTSLTRLTLQENYRLRDLSPLSGLTSIYYFDLDAIGVEDISPLVLNSGLSSGDIVSLDDVTTLNADAAGHIATLEGRGVTVWGGNVEEARQWQVQNVRVAPGPGRLTVTWDPLPDAENPKTRTKPQGYKVQWRSGAQDWSDTVTYKHAPDYADVPGMDRHRVVSGVNTRSYTIPGLTPGVAYTVRIKPDFGTFYAGAPSAEVTGRPLSPDRYPFFHPKTFPAQQFRAGDEIEPVTLPAARDGDGALRYALSPEPALPAGLSFAAATRTLAGTPADVQDAATYTLTATDADGDTTSLTFSITVVPDGQPTFGDAAVDAQDYVEHLPIPQLALPPATGGDGTLRYALAPEPALPDGLTYTPPGDPTTGGGTIAGTPREAQPTTTYALTATDEDGDVTDPPLHLVLHVAADSIPTFGDATMDAQDLTMRASIRSIPLPAARGGNPSLRYTLTPDLPAGMSFDPQQRMIGGMPTEAMSETTYALSAMDRDGDVTDPPLHFALAVFSAPLQVTLEDAAAVEGRPVRFLVQLSRASIVPLTLTWRTGTAGGATPDEDYRAEAAGVLTVPAGETEATLSVPTLEDRQVEPVETFTVTAALPAAAPGSMARSEATGTITDNDAAAARKRSLGMVLAGVGRTLAADTVDVIGGRFGQPTPEATAVLGGQELSRKDATRAGRWRHAAGVGYGVARALGLEVGSPLAGAGPLGQPGGAAWSTLTRALSTAAWDAPGTTGGAPVSWTDDAGNLPSGPDDVGRHAREAAFHEAWGGSEYAPGLAGYDGLAQRGFDRAHAASPRMQRDAWRWRRPVGFRRVSATEMLTRSRFDVPLGDRDSTPGASGWTLWGRGTASGFNGKPKDDFSMNGDVYSGYLGLDYRARPDVLLGLAAAHSRGDVDYAIAGVTKGNLDVELTSVLPYAHWTPRPGLGVWGLLGAGWGSAELRDEAGTVKSDLEMLMAAGGVRQELLKWRRVGLALKADTFLTELETDRKEGSPETAGDAQRVRLLLESRTDWEMSDESHVTPVLELGGRWDGGKAETGLGAELGGRLEYAHTRLGFGLEAGGRYLLAHQKSAFDEWGASLTLRLDPGVAKRGLWLTFAPVWGAEASKVAQMWNGADVLRTSAAPETDDAPGLSPAHFALDLGYGWVTHEGAGLLTTYGGVGMAGPETRDYRLGGTLAVGACVDVSMEGARETRFSGATAHEIMLSGSVCW